MSVHGADIGQLIVVERKFRFDTPGILTGAPLYYPTPGDWLWDGFIVTDDPWDGITPLGDWGLLTIPKPGFLATIGTALTLSLFQDMTVAWTDAAIQYAPSQFETNDPVCVIVTKTGLPGGGDPGASQGGARLVLKIGKMSGEGTG
jgi:hypothetical protein